MDMKLINGHLVISILWIKDIEFMALIAFKKKKEKHKRY